MAYGYANPYGAVNRALAETGRNIRWIGSDISANKRSQAQLGLQGSQLELKKAQVESNLATQQKKMEFLVQENKPTSGEDLIRLFYAGNPKKAEEQIEAFNSVEGGKSFLTDLHSPRDAAIALKGVTNQAALDAEIAKDDRTQKRLLEKEGRGRESKRILKNIDTKSEELEGLRESLRKGEMTSEQEIINARQRVLKLNAEIIALNKEHSQIGTGATTPTTGLGPQPGAATPEVPAATTVTHQMKDGTTMAGPEHPGAVPGSTQRTDLGGPTVQTGDPMVKNKQTGKTHLVGEHFPIKSGPHKGKMAVVMSNGDYELAIGEDQSGIGKDPSIANIEVPVGAEEVAAPAKIPAGKGLGGKGLAASEVYEIAPPTQRPPGSVDKILAGLSKSAGQIKEGLGAAGKQAAEAVAGVGPAEATQDITPEDSIAAFDDVAKEVAKAFPEAPELAQQMQAVAARSLGSANPQEREAARQELITLASGLLEILDNSKVEAGLDNLIGPISDQARAKIEALEERGFGNILRDIITGMSQGTDPARFQDEQGRTIPPKLRKGYYR